MSDAELVKRLKSTREWLARGDEYAVGMPSVEAAVAIIDRAITALSAQDDARDRALEEAATHIENHNPDDAEYIRTLKYKPAYIRALKSKPATSTAENPPTFLSGHIQPPAPEVKQRLVERWRVAMGPMSKTAALDAIDMEKTLDIVEHHITRELDTRLGGKS